MLCCGEWVDIGCEVALSSHRFLPFVIGERVPRAILRPPEALPVATVDDDVRHREKSGLKADVEFSAEFDPNRTPQSLMATALTALVAG